MRIVPQVCLKTAVALLLAGNLPAAIADEPSTLRLIEPAATPVLAAPNESTIDAPAQPTADEPDEPVAGKPDRDVDQPPVSTDASGEKSGESADDGATAEPKSDAPAASGEAPAAAEPTDSSSELPPLSPQLIDLRNRLRRVVAQYYSKHLVVPQRSCWEVMHGIIAYGVDAKLFRTASSRQTVNAIGWMCYNQPCHGEQLFYLNHGKLVARLGPGLQGHTGQFLAIIAQSHVPTTFPMKIGGRNFTVQDLIEYEKSDCREGEELTFKLISMSHYLSTEDEWTTRDGQKWSVSRLIRAELKQPILRVAACGGTHRLMGHSYALYKRRNEGLPIDGQFARAEKFIADYHRYTFSLQNADGSFSTRWFEGREARPDIDRRLKTTGHILEWMSFSVPEERLDDPRMVKAANYIVTLLARNPNREWEVGPLGHALHALRIYDRRMFQEYDTTSDPQKVLEPTTADRQPARSSEAKPSDLKMARRPEPSQSTSNTVAAPAPETSTEVEAIPAVPPIEPISGSN